MQLNQDSINFVKKNFTSSWRFRLTMLRIVPMGFLCGMKVTELSETTCSVTVPFKWLNKNPFKSTFWAVLGMAAEMSSGALLTLFTFRQHPSVAMIIVKSSAEFVKKAQDITTFTCEDGQKIRQAIQQTMQTKEPELIECKMTGINLAGETVAHFTFTWSVKGRENG